LRDLRQDTEAILRAQPGQGSCCYTGLQRLLARCLGKSARTVATHVVRARSEAGTPTASVPRRAARGTVRFRGSADCILGQGQPSRSSHRMSRNRRLWVSLCIRLGPSAASRNLPDTLRRIHRQNPRGTSWPVLHSKRRCERGFHSRCDGPARARRRFWLCCVVRRRQPSDGIFVRGHRPLVLSAWQFPCHPIVSKTGRSTVGASVCWQTASRRDHRGNRWNDPACAFCVRTRKGSSQDFGSR